MLINRKKHNIRKFLLLILISTVFTFIILSTYFSSLKPEIDNNFYYENLTIKVLNVGNSDCIVLLYKNDAILIDTSTDSNSNLLKEELQKLNINTISHLILTHFHKDHIGGAATVMSYFNVNSVDTTSQNLKQLKNTITCAAFPKYLLSLICNYHISNTLKVHDKIYLDNDKNVYLDILGPVLSDYKNVNNTSLVMKLVYGNFSMLFTGDAEYTEEFSLIQSNTNLKSNILKGAHHGYSTSNSEQFIKTVSPDYVIFSTGSDENGYVHFGNDSFVMNKFKMFNIPVLTTYQNGIITITSDGSSYKICY